MLRSDTTLASLTEILRDDPDFGDNPEVAALAMLTGYIQATCRLNRWPYVHADVLTMLRNGEPLHAVLYEMSLRGDDPEPEDDDDPHP